MNAKTLVAAATLLVMAMVTTACGSAADAGNKYQWRQTHHAKPVSVSVGKPNEFVTSGEYASPPNRRAWQVVVVVINRGAEPVDLAKVRLEGLSGGVSRKEVIDPSAGCHGTPSATVQPDQTLSFTACWVGGDVPRVVRVTAPGTSQPVRFSA